MPIRSRIQRSGPPRSTAQRVRADGSSLSAPTSTPVSRPCASRVGVAMTTMRLWISREVMLSLTYGLAACHDPAEVAAVGHVEGPAGRVAHRRHAGAPARVDPAEPATERELVRRLQAGEDTGASPERRASRPGRARDRLQRGELAPEASSRSRCRRAASGRADRRAPTAGRPCTAPTRDRLRRRPGRAPRAASRSRGGGGTHVRRDRRRPRSRAAARTLRPCRSRSRAIPAAGRGRARGRRGWRECQHGGEDLTAERRATVSHASRSSFRRLGRTPDRGRERGYAASVLPVEGAAMKALVIVDMLDDFVTGALANPDAQRIVAPLSRLLAHARANEDWVVVFSNDAHHPSDPELRVWGPHALAGTPGAEVIRELAPEPGARELVSPKRAYGAFEGTGLDERLKALGVDEIVADRSAHAHLRSPQRLRRARQRLPADGPARRRLLLRGRRRRGRTGVPRHGVRGDGHRRRPAHGRSGTGSLIG